MYHIWEKRAMSGRPGVSSKLRWTMVIRHRVTDGAPELITI
jgi:hypothetical protein